MTATTYSDDVCVIRSPHDIPKRAKRILVKPRTLEPVRAHLAANDGETETKDGEKLQFLAGRHYVVDGPDGQQSVVKRSIFKKTYQRVGDRGWFRKRPDLKLQAAVCDRAAEVHTLEGVQTAEPGDLIMVGVDGEVWPVSADAARRRYRQTTRMNWATVEIGMMTALVIGYFLVLAIS